MEPAPDQNEQVEIGLRVINAHRLWQIGITGAGRLVMNVDTGVDGNHPALNSRWRGNWVPWYHAWFDRNGSTNFPTDCQSHGTHTIGTMCGRGADDTVGVAPDARWIAARTICSSPHTSNSIAAFQWAMNPDSHINSTFLWVSTSNLRLDLIFCIYPYIYNFIILAGLYAFRPVSFGSEYTKPSSFVSIVSTNASINLTKLFSST